MARLEVGSAWLALARASGLGCPLPVLQASQPAPPATAGLPHVQVSVGAAADCGLGGPRAVSLPHATT